VIAQISENDEVLAYLDQIGVRPGAEVSVKDVAPLDGPLTIETEEGVTPLGKELASLVRIATAP
jgi:Fe2+ transport system protein FeoA